jgi:hypothetical protein
MSSKMSMVFSENGGNVGKITRKVAPLHTPIPAPAHKVVPAPVQVQTKPRYALVGLMANNRSAPRGVSQLFNIRHIMANPGTPCKACGS